MNNPIISFIIPIYNGSKYLYKCVDSIINQDIPSELFEIICIDDCSSDDSVIIIEKYRSKHSNIKLIEMSQNSKTGTVCNTGLDAAKGKYIWIIGQDDWIKANCLSNLVQTLETNKLDLLAFNYRRVSFEEQELHSAEVFDNSEIGKGEEYIRSRFGNAFPHYLLGYEWRAIFNRNFLKKHTIRFPDGVIYEDTTFLFQAILFAKRFKSISDFIYFYRVNTNSITDVNKKYRADLVFEFSFTTGNEVFELSRRINIIYPDFAEILFEIAKTTYFNSFSYKIVGAAWKEKNVFYKLVKSNSSMIQSIKPYLNNTSRILTNKYVGFSVSVLLKPVYLIKLKIKNARKPKQDWCY